MKSIAYVLANFGGPRSIEEIAPFLRALLTDKDVIRTKLPHIIQDLLFKRIAKKRAKKIAKDYQKIGGKSPIFQDTEDLAAKLRTHLNAPLLTFHRYLPATHQAFIQAIDTLNCDEIRVFPLFPQFTYATTGSIARWFGQNLEQKTINSLRWVKSYPTHPRFISTHQRIIREFLSANHLKEEETCLLFSAHGVPKSFIEKGDIYRDECEASFTDVAKDFPRALCRLSFQSQFGKEEWIKPSTESVCQDVLSWSENRKHIVFIPITFTSDHIETLFEIEEEYMPIIAEKGLKPYRIPALTLDPEWIETILEIVNTKNYCNNQMLIRSV